MTVSSSNLLISQSMDFEPERDGLPGSKAQHPSSKTLLRNNRVRPAGRSQSKPKPRREAARSDVYQPGSTLNRQAARPSPLSPKMPPAILQGTAVERGQRFHVPNTQPVDNYDLLSNRTIGKAQNDKGPATAISHYATRAPAREQFEIIL